MSDSIVLTAELGGLHALIDGIDHLPTAISEHDLRGFTLRDESVEVLRLPAGGEGLDHMILKCPKLRAIHCEAQLDGMTTVWIDSCPLESLAFVREMPRLSLLGVHNDQCQTLHDLAGHPALSFLLISGSAAHDFSAIESLPSLIELNLLNTSCDSLDPILRQKPMKILSIARTRVSSLLGLDRVEALHDLSLSGCRMTDLGGLAGANSLSDLQMRETRCGDYSPLSSLPNVARIELSGSNIVDLGALRGCHSLYDLSIRNTAVPSLLPLLELPALEQVTVSDDMANLEGVAEMKERGVTIELQRYPNRDDNKGLRVGSWTY